MKPESVKVRPIWLSDADWAALQAKAAARDINVSQLIRAELVKEKK